MDGVVTLLVRAVAWLIGQVLLYCTGWIALKALTLGRYPRARHPFQQRDSLDDFYEISFVGLGVLILAVILISMSKFG